MKAGITRAALVLIASCCSVPAFAAPKPLSQQLIGCWGADVEYGKYSICFGRNRKVVTTSFLGRRLEAFVSGGTYTLNESVLKLKGTDGEGWAGNASQACKVVIDETGEQLILEGCDTAETYKRQCREMTKELECRS
jgi:hypothetical protein